MGSIKNHFQSLFLLTLLIFSFDTGRLHAKPSMLSVADSLFNAEKYTKASQVYDSLFLAGQFSAQMLLKMAYMEEESGNFDKALYFLLTCQQQFPQLEVGSKISELADKYELHGYNPSDHELGIRFITQNRTAILTFGLLLLLIGAGTLFWLKKRQSALALPSILLGAYIVGFLILINYQPTIQKGIVQSEQTLLMGAPAAGAKVIERLGKGHQLEVLGQKDIWLQVKWQDKSAFVRADNLLMLE